MGNVVFFSGVDGSDHPDRDLWLSDGTAAGTYAVGGAQNAGVAGTDGGLSPIRHYPVPRRSSVQRSRLCISITDYGLWFSDGTAAGTYEIGGAKNSGVAGVNPGNLDPTDIMAFGNKALFFGYDLDDFDGLWVTDGTASGTFELGGLKNDGISGRYFQGLVPRRPDAGRKQGVFYRARYRRLISASGSRTEPPAGRSKLAG